jgi:hypothetical protein
MFEHSSTLYVPPDFHENGYCTTIAGASQPLSKYLNVGVCTV